MKRLQSAGAFRALSHPDFFWFWTSYFVSNVGSWMQSIAMGWLLFDLTGSPFYLGLFSSLRMVMLIGFFILGGIMSDRIDRRSVKVQTGAPGGRNHNKFAVIDGSRVLTGSYNWTAKAKSNWENLLVIDCAGLAKAYESELEKVH